MWEPRCLRKLWASTACYRGSFTCYWLCPCCFPTNTLFACLFAHMRNHLILLDLITLINESCNNANNWRLLNSLSPDDLSWTCGPAPCLLWHITYATLWVKATWDAAVGPRESPRISCLPHRKWLNEGWNFCLYISLNQHLRVGQRWNTCHSYCLIILRRPAGFSCAEYLVLSTEANLRHNCTSERTG
jgi:hypothetical protein